jgi:hemoglobin
MKRDIETRQDIELLVSTFYERVKADPVIGGFFSKINWEKHLPVMYDFWDNAIFFSGGYVGNPLNVHQRLHSFINLTPEHFIAWINLFTATVDKLFEGEKATLAKQRANSIAAVMQIKIFKQNAEEK